MMLLLQAIYHLATMTMYLRRASAELYDSQKMMTENHTFSLILPATHTLSMDKRLLLSACHMISWSVIIKRREKVQIALWMIPY